MKALFSVLKPGRLPICGSATVHNQNDWTPSILLWGLVTHIVSHNVSHVAQCVAQCVTQHVTQRVTQHVTQCVQKLLKYLS
jgi:hypothetical protein